MKLWHKLAITFGVLVLLGGAYWYVSTLKPTEDKKPQETPAISLLSVKSGDVKEIHIKNPKIEYTIAKTGDKWSIKEFPNVPYNSTKVENMVYDLVNINANRMVEENPSDLAQYGLQNPTAELTVTMGDGKLYTFVLGNKVESYYYFKDKTSPKVYIVDSYKGEALLKDLSEFRDKELLTVKPEEVTAFKVAYKDGKVMDIGKKPADDKGATMSPFKMFTPYNEGVDSEKLNKVLTAFLPVSAVDFISDNSADVAKYGLDKSDYAVTVKTEKDSYTVRMTQKGQKVYALVDGKNSVVTVDEAKYKAISDINIFGMIEKFAHLINIDNVNSINVEGKGKKFTLSIARTTDNAATPNPDTKQKPEKSDYAINGKTAAEDAFKGAYQDVIGLIVTGEAAGTPQGEAEYTITFNLRTGTSDVYKYIATDARNYAVVSGGMAKYTILKKNVDAMLDKLTKFEQDPSKRVEV